MKACDWWEHRRNERGPEARGERAGPRECAEAGVIHLKEAIVDRLGAMLGPGESYSDAILRLVKLEGACGP